jgi:hypothetical protein
MSSQVKYLLKYSNNEKQSFAALCTEACYGSNFSDATRGRLSDAERCLASEKRSSGKSRGWAWWAVCCYGDLGCGLALDLI